MQGLRCILHSVSTTRTGIQTLIRFAFLPHDGWEHIGDAKATLFCP